LLYVIPLGERKMKSPSDKQIREWKDEDVTQWFFKVLAEKIYQVDTVRNINSDKDNLSAHLLGRKMAVDTIEKVMREIIEEGNFAERQEGTKEDADTKLNQFLNDEY